MKTQLTLGFIASLVLGPPALAQTSWHAPAGNFSIVIPDGWAPRPIDRAAVGVTSAIDLEISPTSSADIGCSIARLNHTAPSDVTQQDANRVLEGWDRDRMVSEFVSTPRATVEFLEFTNVVRDGVQTPSVKFILNNGVRRQVLWQKQFMVALGGNNVAFFTFLCSVPEADKGVEFARTQEAFESLRFRPLAKN